LNRLGKTSGHGRDAVRRPVKRLSKSGEQRRHAKVGHKEETMGKKKSFDNHRNDKPNGEGKPEGKKREKTKCGLSSDTEPRTI